MTVKLLAAFAVVYFVWGSTFLAVRFAVSSIPPFMVGALRNVIAGAALILWARWQHAPWPGAEAWARAMLAGALLFLVNHGGIAWAQQRGVPSGLSAVLVATIPLWIALMQWASSGRRPSTRTGLGLIVGFTGSALLVRRLGTSGIENVGWAGPLVISFAAVSWAAGTLYSRQARLSQSTAMGAGMPMLCGALLLAIVSGLSGEWNQVQHESFSPTALAGLAYLTLAGSLLGFSAYHWLLRVQSPSRVATYAYVNPVVALFFGWLLAGELVSGATLMAAAISLAGVVLVVMSPER